ARAERAGFAGAWLSLSLLLTLVGAAATVGSAGAAEPPEKLLERIRLGFHRDALLGRDVDDRRLQLGDQIGERLRSAARSHDRGRVLRDLGAGASRGQRECRSPEKQGHRDPIGVAHFSGLLRAHRYSIILGWTQGRLTPTALNND